MNLRIGAFRVATLVVLAVLAFTRDSAAFSVRLAWRPVAAATGYRVYVRTSGAAYGAPTDIGNLHADADGIMRYVKTGLTESSTHYFTVTSYTGAIESLPSNEMMLAYAAIAPFIDSDADGLTDAAEDRNLDGVTDPGETNRLRFDTDDDGIDDGSEVANGTNPLDSTDPPASAGACAAALSIAASGGTFSGTTAGVGTLTGSCASTSNAPEKVYRWTPRFSGIALIETCSATGTGFDTIVYVRRGDCTAGKEIGCNDDTASCVTAEPNDHHGSRLAPMVTAGETYFIVVDGYDGSGAFTLHVAAPSGLAESTTPAPPPSATPKPAPTATARPTGTARPTRTPRPTRTRTPTRTTTPVAPPTPGPTATVTHTPTPAATGACAAAVPIAASGGTFTGVTGTRMGHLTGSCAATRNSLEEVFSWTPTTSGVATIDTCSRGGTTFDTVLYVRGRDCLTGPELACNNDDSTCPAPTSGKATGSRVDLNVSAGQTYFIVVDGRNGASGQFTLNVSPPAAATAPTSLGTRATDTAGSSVATTRAPSSGAAPPRGAADATVDVTTSAATLSAVERCQHLTGAITGPAPVTPRTLELSDELGALSVTVEGPRTLCVPVVGVGDGASGAEPLLVRHDVRIRRFSPNPTGAIRLANSLGEVEVDVTKPDSVETSAAVEPPLPGHSDGDASATLIEPRACYKVRVRGGAARHSVLVRSGDRVEYYGVSGPTRLCPDGAPAAGTEPIGARLCYRARRRGAVDDTTASPDRVTLTSALGAATSQVGAVEEICLPSELVSIDAP